MAIASMGEEANLPNHPKSRLMALIASLTFNIGIGSVMGTPGVLLPHMKQHLGVSTEMVSMGMLAVMISASLISPKIGSLAVRHSLRGMLAVASLMLGAAWLLLFLTHSYPLYLAIEALLMGPVMAIMGSVLAPTLVTRWFNSHRGLAIGLVHLPVMVAIMPIAAEWLIQHIGLQATFLVLAALPLVTTLPASLLLLDWPPEKRLAGAVALSGSAQHGPMVTIAQMLKQPRFWALTLAVTVPNTSSIMLGTHLVSMAESWGIQPLAAAGLASIMSLVGMVGTVGLGLVVDRLGGARTLALMAAGDALLWLCLLSHPAYPMLAAIIGLIGMFGAGAVPAICKAYADAFGRASFSRAIGLMPAVMIPALAIGLIGPGVAVRVYGNYVPVILAMAAAFLVSFGLALSVAGGGKKAHSLSSPIVSV
jgi:predicted MFS family arabinose efflux permease